MWSQLLWHSFDLSAAGVSIEAGSVYIGVRWNGSHPPGVFLWADQSTDRPVGYAGGFVSPPSWTPLASFFPSYRAMFVRPVMVSSAPSMLSVTPTSGSIEGGSSEVLTVTANTEGAVPGAYNFEVLIATNDPVNPVLEVPVTVEVADPACSLTWSTALQATSAGSVTTNLSFGQGPALTAGLDEACGEFELPPAPPGFEARFLLPGGTIGSYRDYRSDAAEGLVWSISLSGSSEVYPVEFTWDPSSLPSGRGFFLRDAVTGGDLVLVDMTAQGSFTHTLSAMTVFEIVEQLSASVSVVADWNMLSVPLQADDMSPVVLFPGATSSFFAFSGGYVASDPLVAGRGYWAKFGEAGSYEITGSLADPQVVSVTAGWNMIGFFEAPVAVSAIESNPAGIIASNYFGYSAGYALATTLQPGRGYWVKANAPGTLTAGSSARVAGEGVVASKAEDPLSGAARLVMEDAAGRSATLYLLEEEVEALSLVLPPRPPTGAFDVRFAGDLAGVPVASGAVVAELSGAVYPVRLSVEQLEGSLWLRDVIDGSLFEVELREGGEAVLRLPLTHLQVQAVGDGWKATLPEEYALEAAYPNPSAGRVTIGYSLPEAGHVRLTLYDVLGRTVLQMVDDEMPAGRHETTIPAGLASGTYLYRIEAGGFVQTRHLTITR